MIERLSRTEDLRVGTAYLLVRVELQPVLRINPRRRSCGRNHCLPVSSVAAQSGRVGGQGLRPEVDTTASPTVSVWGGLV
jgi:hypothetical protein